MLAEIAVTALLVIGGIFGLIGSFGLIKLKDPMQRLHAPTKATTVGVGSALLASVVYFLAFRDTMTWQEVLIILFLFLTAPITALYIGKVHLHLTVPRKDLPETGTKRVWSTFDDRLEKPTPEIDRQP